MAQAKDAGTLLKILHEVLRKNRAQQGPVGEDKRAKKVAKASAKRRKLSAAAKAKISAAAKARWAKAKAAGKKSL
jgi:hypothetical protein